MLIYTMYKGEGEKKKRGTLKDEIFCRDKVPTIWGDFISLEPDVLEQIETKGCRLMIFRLRDGKRVTITPTQFKATAETRRFGKPDCRLQYLLDLRKVPVDDPQGRLF